MGVGLGRASPHPFQSGGIVLVVKKTQMKASSKYPRIVAERPATLRQFPAQSTAETAQRVKYNRAIKRFVDSHF